MLILPVEPWKEEEEEVLDRGMNRPLVLRNDDVEEDEE